MNTEEQVVRPYEGLDRISGALDGCHLMFGPHRVDPAKILRVSDHEFLNLPAALWVARDEDSLDAFHTDLYEGLAACEVEPVDAELVVVVSTPRLKIADVAVRHSLDKPLLSPHIGLTPDARPAPFKAPTGGARVDVYVALGRDLDPAPLRAWRKGTWLAHQQLEVRTEAGDVGFVVLPLTEDRRYDFDLPPGSIRHIVIDDPLAPTDDADVIEIYVDEEILGQMTHRPTSAVAELFQRQLFLDAMTAVISTATASASLHGLSWGDVEDTLLGRVLSRIAGPLNEQTAREHSVRCESLLRLVANQPSTVLPWLEALVPDLGRKLSDGLRGTP